MSTKLILTSALALAIASPAFADPTSGSWNEIDGTMWQNTVYTDAATEQHTGITEGTVTAEAYYTWNTYSVEPGSYWPQATEWGQVPQGYMGTWADYTQCPAGSYCEGSWNQPLHYEQSTDQFIATCPGMYTSAAGSAVIADCYGNDTTTTCQKPAHATLGSTMTGINYYGWGYDTCALVPASGDTSGCLDGYTYINPRSISMFFSAGGANVTKSASSPSSGTFTVSYSVSSGTSTIDLGTLAMNSACSKLTTNEITGNSVTKYAAVTNDGTTDAVNCYCQGYAFTPGAGLSDYFSAISNHLLETQYMGSQISESPWRKAYTFDSASNCSSYCATVCSEIMTGATTPTYMSSITESNILGEMYTQPTCEANKIDITWRGATPSAIAANNAGSTWFEKDIRTPVEAVTLPGKTFQGWRFLSKDPQTGNDTATPVTLGTGESMSQETPGVIVTGSMQGDWRPYDGPAPTDPAQNPGNGGSGSGNGGY